MSERDEVLSEVGRTLQGLAVERFTTHGPRDRRGAAFWDAACFVVEHMADGDWRKRPIAAASPEATPE